MAAVTSARMSARIDAGTSGIGVSAIRFGSFSIGVGAEGAFSVALTASADLTIPIDTPAVILVGSKN